ncbi:19478_t:CDS:2, partial [Rhizophagus irregularis]
LGAYILPIIASIFGLLTYMNLEDFNQESDSREVDDMESNEKNEIDDSNNNSSKEN